LPPAPASTSQSRARFRVRDLHRPRAELQQAGPGLGQPGGSSYFFFNLGCYYRRAKVGGGRWVGGSLEGGGRTRRLGALKAGSPSPDCTERLVGRPADAGGTTANGNGWCPSTARAVWPVGGSTSGGRMAGFPPRGHVRQTPHLQPGGGRNPSTSLGWWGPIREIGPGWRFLTARSRDGLFVGQQDWAGGGGTPRLGTARLLHGQWHN